MMRALICAFLLAVVGGSAVSCCSACRGARVVPVSGTEWALIELSGGIVERQGERLTLTLGTDGRVAGTGDCNRFFGGYTYDEAGRIAITGLGSTRRMCPDQAVEDAYFRALQGAATFSVDGDFLLLRDADGTLLASFRKLADE